MHPFSRRRAAIAPLLVAAFALASCTDSATAPEALAPGESPTLLVVSGDAQTGAVGAELGAPIVVKAVKANGNPLPHQIVNFRVVSGGGTVFAGSSITDAHGVAQEYWTLGTTTGANVLEVRAVDPSTGAKQTFATFTAVAVAGPVARITVTPATGTVRELETLALSATAEDRFGNAVSGRPFTWSSADDAIASVSSAGVVSGKLAGGPVAILASAEGVSGSAAITVTPKLIAADQGEPDARTNPRVVGTLAPGQNVSMSATIHTVGDEDWYQVTVKRVFPAGCIHGDIYSHPLTIDLKNIPAGSDYAIDIRADSPTDPAYAISQKPGNSDEQLVEDVLTGCGDNQYPTRSYFVRVYSASGAPSAAAYTLSFKYE